MRTPASQMVKIGVSACLLGTQVRYDGGHKENEHLALAAACGVTFLPICPEVECGFGVPREPMRLERHLENPRLLTVTTQVDKTDRLAAWCRARIIALRSENLAGFVFKARSPSCGLMAVPVFAISGAVLGSGQGIFSRAVTEAYPHMLLAQDEQVATATGVKQFFAACASKGQVARDGMHKP